MSNYPSEAPDKEIIEWFPQNITLPTLEIVDIEALDEAVGVDDIQRAINKIKNGKAPGPDGFPMEF